MLVIVEHAFLFEAFQSFVDICRGTNGGEQFVEDIAKADVTVGVVVILALDKGLAAIALAELHLVLVGGDTNGKGDWGQKKRVGG